MTEKNERSSRNIYKPLFFTLIFFVILAVVAGSAYWYGKQQSGGASFPVMIKNPADIPNVTAYQPGKNGGNPLPPGAESVSDRNIVPIGPNTVSFARTTDGIVLIRYRGKIYDVDYKGDPSTLKNYKESDYTWYGLVDAPTDVPAGEFALDEFFFMLPAPNGKDFAFTMRWGTDKSNFDSIAYYLYSYKAGGLTLVKKFSNAEMNPYVPVLSSFSADGQYVSLNMFPCWNCGGGQPNTGLLNLMTKAYKDIGKVSYFKWTAAPNYEYKEYKTIACGPEVEVGECSEKPENLPMKTGTF